MSNNESTAELKADQIERVEQMAEDLGDTWDLNKRDRAAIKALLADRAAMLQALREVAGGCYALEKVGLGPRCVFCLMREGKPHDPDCTMQFVNAALAKAEAR